MKLLMLKGLPGSGKSTWAKKFVADNQGWVRINRDSIRSMIVYKRKQEDLVCKFRDMLDDRQRVVDMWRDIGLKVLQVAEGNF